MNPGGTPSWPPQTFSSTKSSRSALGSNGPTLAGDVVDAQGGAPGTTAEPELWQALQILAVAGLDVGGAP